MLAAVLVTFAVAVAVYEWVAVETRKVSTITDLVKALPFWVRLVGATLLPLYLWIDHIWWNGGLV